MRKLTEVVDGKLRFASAPPLLTPLHELHASADPDEREAYVRELLDAVRGGPARRPRAPLPLLRVRRHGAQGGRRRQRRHPRLGVPPGLAAAAATRSCCRPRRRRPRCSSPTSARSEYDNHGERVVRGQRMMQAATDIFLSWQRSTGLDGVEHDFYVRQLWDWKASADLSRMSEHGLLTYTPRLRLVAGPLARALGRPARDRRLPRQGRRLRRARSPASRRATPTRTSSTTGGCSRRPPPRARSPPSTTSNVRAGKTRADAADVEPLGVPACVAAAAGIGVTRPWSEVFTTLFGGGRRPPDVGDLRALAGGDRKERGVSDGLAGRSVGLGVGS